MQAALARYEYLTRHPLRSGVEDAVRALLLSFFVDIAMPVYNAPTYGIASLLVAVGLVTPGLACLEIFAAGTSATATGWRTVPAGIVRASRAARFAAGVFVALAGIAAALLFAAPLLRIYAPVAYPIIVGVLASVVVADLLSGARLIRCRALTVFTPIWTCLLSALIVMFRLFLGSGQAECVQIQSSQPIEALWSREDLAGRRGIANATPFDLAYDAGKDILFVSLKDRFEGYLRTTDEGPASRNAIALFSPSLPGRASVMQLRSRGGSTRAEALLLDARSERLVSFVSERNQPHSLRTYDYRSGGLVPIQVLELGDREPIDLLWTQAGARVLVIFMDGSIREFRFPDLQETRSRKAGAGFTFGSMAAFSGANRRIYFAKLSGGMDVIDADTLQIAGEISPGRGIGAVAVDEQGQRVFATEFPTGNLLEIDMATSRIRRGVPTVDVARNITVLEENGMIAVAGYPSGRVCIHRGSTLEMSGCIEVGKLARALARDPEGWRLFTGSSCGVFSIDVDKLPGSPAARPGPG